MATKKTAMRSRRNSNKGSMILITIVAAMIIVVLLIKGNELNEKKQALEKREAYLLEQIEAQYERSEEIEEYRKYMQTKQYIEDEAKSKLGLVYKDEIIFEADN